MIDYAQNQLKNDILAWKGNWLFIGEWSIASSATFNDDDLRRYAQAQLAAFKQQLVDGHIGHGNFIMMMVQKMVGV